MADVSALFASRKNKVKKKKKKKTAVSLLDQEEADELRQDNESEPDISSQLVLGSISIASDEDEWVDDDDEDEDIPVKGLLMAGKVAKDVLELDTEAEDENKVPLTIQSEVIKTKFHMARKQALTAPIEVPKPVEQEKPKKWVVRARVEHEAKASGAHALKNMDSEVFFPALGGQTKPVKPVLPPVSAWGTVDPVVEKNTGPVINKPTPQYLDADFIASESFNGAKPGYAFLSGKEGTGYYWEGGEEAKVKDEDNDEEAKVKCEDNADEDNADEAKVKDEDNAEEKKKEVVNEDKEEDSEYAELMKLKKKKKKKKKKKALTDE